MSFSIEGKTAIVTGAANGVGLAISKHFVNMGANVVFADMDEEKLKDEISSFAGEDSTYEERGMGMAIVQGAVENVRSVRFAEDFGQVH